MNGETKDKAFELSDEEIESVAGGSEQGAHRCAFAQQMTPGSMQEEFCHKYCAYGHPDYTVHQALLCTNGMTTASDDSVRRMFKIWNNSIPRN